MNGEVRPKSYIADQFSGVEHIRSDSLMALHGKYAGVRLIFNKNWAGNAAPVNIFLTEEDACRLSRELTVVMALHSEGQRTVNVHGDVPVNVPVVGNGSKSPYEQG